MAEDFGEDASFVTSAQILTALSGGRSGARRKIVGA
jgi:hypothetical protein